MVAKPSLLNSTLFLADLIPSTSMTHTFIIGSGNAGKNSMFSNPIRPDRASSPPPLRDAQVLAEKVKGDPSIRETQTELGYTLVHVSLL